MLVKCINFTSLFSPEKKYFEFFDKKFGGKEKGCNFAARFYPKGKKQREKVL